MSWEYVQGGYKYYTTCEQEWSQHKHITSCNSPVRLCAIASCILFPRLQSHDSMFNPMPSVPCLQSHTFSPTPSVPCLQSHAFSPTPSVPCLQSHDSMFGPLPPDKTEGSGLKGYIGYCTYLIEGLYRLLYIPD